jgi:hypothetical protein
MKFKNMTNKSLAESKRIWKGDKGRYAPKDLAKWFKLYDETQLFEARKLIDKKFNGDVAHEGYLPRPPEDQD